MFSQGQWTFAAIFMVAFIILMIFSYRKDILLHKRYYKGSLFVLIAFLGFIGLLFVLRWYLGD